MKPRLGITIGDFNGIGPEVVLKAIALPAVRKICQPYLIGPLSIFESVAKLCKINVSFERTTVHNTPKGKIPVIDVGEGISSDIKFGQPSRVAGRTAGQAIEKAIELTLRNKLDAFVTAPVSKESLHLAGYNFPGQTEMIALFSGTQRVLMVLGNQHLKVGLVTIHTALRDVPLQISKEKIIDKTTLLYESLQQDFKIKDPKIAILSLNPHAGEHGVIGTEEETLIIPAITEVRNKKWAIEGPFAADGFFGTHSYRYFDAVLAMYHDQGLIPLKMIDFEKGVNFTAGLKIVRTSPDHGTAYDIAGKNKASPSSMIEAIRWAVTISQNRHHS
ncbi:MAG: 4-hydroxythreonine-4-phosphate dehydrogenase PdxA [Bacteroidetes bacterium]|nr:4-hydroxythreonine-4-phosphate dehydrogenase PdxA [Bacteroidota bacterium]